MKQVLSGLILVVVLGLAAGCGAPAASPDAPAAVVSASDAATALGPNIDAKTLAAVKDRPDVVVLDVREQSEYAEGHIPGVVLIPMNSVPARLADIPTTGEVIVTCRSGNRSSQVTAFLREQGYTNVHNLEGGILAWQRAGLPVER